MRPNVVLFLSLSISFAHASAAYSQSSTEKDIKSAMKQYEAKAAVAQKRLLSAFDKNAQIIKQSGLDRESIASRLVTNADQRKAFLEYNTLPSDEAFTPVLFEYAMLMHQAQMPLVNAYDAAYKKAIEKNDLDTLRFLTNDKASVDKAMKSREQFQAGTVWEGFRNQTTQQLIDAKKPQKGFKLVQSQFTLKMKVAGVNANAFEGNFEQNIQYGNHPEFKVNGQMQGTFIKWWIETPVNTTPRKHIYTGYVLGDRIIGRLDGFTPNGEPLVAFFRLTKKN